MKFGGVLRQKEQIWGAGPGPTALHSGAAMSRGCREAGPGRAPGAGARQRGRPGEERGGAGGPGAAARSRQAAFGREPLLQSAR